MRDCDNLLNSLTVHIMTKEEIIEKLCKYCYGKYCKHFYFSHFENCFEISPFLFNNRGDTLMGIK